MATERSPMLSAPAAHPRRRALFLVAGAIALIALVIAVVTLSSSSSSSTPVSVRSSPQSEGFTPTVTFPADALGRRELLSYCEEKFFTQPVNQFVADGGGATFAQRYFVCGRDQFFRKDRQGAIFLYTGNEGDVLLYLNNTGLMWENAEEFKALLVFAEHRYFGESVPFGDAAADHMEFLGSAQALADYAALVQHIKEELDVDVPVIGFGGSYGGMLAAWFRLKYPHILDGAISGSAPLLHFLNDPDHPVDTEAFQRIVTFDMSPAAGASANCAPSVRRAFAALLRLSETSEGRQLIAQELRLCNPDKLQAPQDIRPLIDAAADVFGNLAMGNYPYPTSYIMEGVVNLPAYPMRAACEHLAPEFDAHDDRALLAGLRGAVGVYFNATQDAACLFEQAAIDVDLKNLGEYIKCWELYMPVSSDSVHDVFPRQDANFSADDARCVATWGIHLRPSWPETQYGGVKALAQASNIVFSNGNYDPWSGTGVLHDLAESVVALVIDGGGHHVDLFFRHELDPPSLTQARETEKQYMRKWINEFYERKTK